MGIFESQTKKNERLFGSAQYAQSKIVTEEFMGEPELVPTMAWSEGGVYMARYGVERLETLKAAFGKGELLHTACLSSLFTVTMIPRWYRAQRGRQGVFSDAPSPTEKDEARGVELGTQNILNLFEHRVTMVECLNLYKQFVYECEWMEGKHAPPDTGSPYIANMFQDPHAYNMDNAQRTYVTMLLNSQAVSFSDIGVEGMPVSMAPVPWSFMLTMDLAFRACGKPPAIDWHRQTFPVTKFDDIRWEAPLYPDALWSDFKAWLELLALAQDYMFSIQRELHRELRSVNSEVKAKAGRMLGARPKPGRDDGIAEMVGRVLRGEQENPQQRSD